MPRHGGNTLRPNRRTHKPMNSGRKGKGGDAKLKKAKQLAGEAKNPKPRKKEREDRYDPA